MNNFLTTFKNIWKIEELRNRILVTIGFILIYRLGSFVVLPGIDINALADLQKQTDSGLLGLLNTFTGGAFAKASIFALGIMPYISASIVIQLLGIAVPYFQKLRRRRCDRAPAWSSPTRMRMRVLARVVKMVAATDCTAIAIARLLRDRFLMSPCRVLRCRVLVLSSSRLSLVASRSSPDTSVVVRGFLEGGVGPKGPRASDRSIDRPTTLPTAVARARRSRGAIGQVHEGGAAAV